MIRVRFHLGRGKHFGHWQIKRPDGSTDYADPATAELLMERCRLTNQRGASNRIFAGANKQPCAWVVCDRLTIRQAGATCPQPGEQTVAFNPRTAPHWRDCSGRDIDGATFARVISRGRALFAS